MHLIEQLYEDDETGESGQTIVELALVAGVIGFFVAQQLGVFQTIRNSIWGTAATQNFRTIAGCISDKYEGENYSSLDNSVAIQNECIPEGSYVIDEGSNTIQNNWGGNMDIRPAASNLEFEIEESSLPSSVCTDVATMSGSEWTSVTVNGTTQDVPMDIGTATANCQDGSTNTVALTHT